MSVTQLLQGTSIDICDATDLILALKTTLTSVRSSIDEYHAKWYKNVKDLADAVKVREWKPRTSIFQQHRNNVPSDDISEYYKRAVTIPLLDHLIVELQSRFDASSVNSLNGLVIIPSKIERLHPDDHGI